MDHRRHQSNNGMSYSNLFNLEPLMNYQLPRHGHEDDDNYGNSSQDDSTSSQGQGDMLGYSNGRRKRASADVDSDEDDEEDYGTRFSEEQYRSMLGEHAEKYRRVRFDDPTAGMGSARVAMPAARRHSGSQSGRYAHDSLGHVKEEMRIRDLDRSPEYLEEDFESGYGGSTRLPSALESSYLDIGEGITYRIPPTYDRLATTLKLPSYSDIKIDEYFLKGMLDVRSLAAFVAGDRRFEIRNRGGLAEPQTQYESLQARLKALSASNSNQKFSLVVSDLGLDTVPEGAAGRIRRLIMSESGTMQVYYVKVLEKGDTYEIIERSLPKKLVVKKDPSTIEKEETDKIGKIWLNIVRRDIPKHHRSFTNLHRKQIGDAKRFSEMCQREVKVKVSRSIKLMRGAAIRTKKLARDMLLFWKRVDREQAEQQKKDEKEAAERLKREQELREAKRQQQSLNFLISQTELYSHFMQNKSIPQSTESLALMDSDSKALEGTSALEDTGQEDEKDIEEAKMRRQAAMEVAQRAVSEQQKITNNFDSDTLKLRQAGEPTFAENDSAITGSTNIDLLNPSTMPTTSSVQAPELFKGCLKDYQLKGLQWLVNCYEKGLNGILADEMGLGKTIQAMAFLAHLAEEKDIWGPFLVVAPSSVLNNWVDEIRRFCPDLKTLPYWGGLPERNILRKNINPKRLYRRDAGFHILITSYQLIISDEKYLRRVKWQYMVLDEAQAIKSSNSIRWKTLLSFNCRNRLLLTGTPIQNNMAELWALLHFIMPTLFNSHEQFNEWFSKGIESHAEHGGTLNEHQLNRLHAVLKPFMLRRVKKDVITEMTSKTEVKVLCKLSSRQQAFYQAIKNKISLAEVFDSNRGHLNEKKIVNLMNIVIQLRKVCNHPELFERNEGSSYLYFSEIPNSLLPPPPFGELENIHYSGDWNPIVYKVPKLIHEEIVRNTEMPCSVVGHSLQRNTFERLFNIFSPDNIYHSTVSHSSNEYYASDTTFGFTRLVDLSPVEVSFLAKGSLLERLLFSVITWDRQFVDETLDLLMDWEGDDLRYNHLEEAKMRAVARMLLLPKKSEASILRRKLDSGPGDAPFEPLVISHQERFISNIRLLRSSYAYIPQARAPRINVQCSDRSFAYQMVEELHNPWAKKQFLGFARTSEFNGPRVPCGPHYLIKERDTEPMLQLTYRIFGSSPPMRSFDPAKMLTDSGKLQTLDILLKRLRAEDHRVLLFAQMTKMLNIIEDYMNYRKYKYLRLDGSSNINDRRDMVRDFQHRSDIFVFLLSTRAGGLGINLTAADTVIFYESDWNPTLDLQAMDRAHRLGQTKEVTVYRLICKDTVEEKILQRASQKNTVQQLVMTGGNVQGDLMKPEDVFSLIMDDAQLEKMREIPLLAKERQKKKRPSKGIRVDADGVVSLEDLENPASQGADYESAEQHNVNSDKKRKSKPDNQTPKSRNPSKPGINEDMGADVDEYVKMGDDEDHIQQRPTRSKKPKKSVHENLEPALNFSSNADYYPQSPYDHGLNDYGDDGEQEGMLSHSRSPIS